MTTSSSSSHEQLAAADHSFLQSPYRPLLINDEAADIMDLDMYTHRPFSLINEAHVNVMVDLEYSQMDSNVSFLAEEAVVFDLDSDEDEDLDSNDNFLFDIDDDEEEDDDDDDTADTSDSGLWLNWS